METQELKRIVEALIFAADAPISAERILDTLDLQNGFSLSAVIDELNAEYLQSGRAFTIRQVAGGYQIVTQSQYASWIKKLYLGRQKTRLSQAALETLALIAFKQPISRVEIGQIRGVNSDGVIGTLLERKLITISGRSEAVGRPLLYSTTPEFLKYFGINDITDLPKPREIEELFSKEGMPEELLHALSQEDPQLSLPINTDGAIVSEETDNKITPSIDQPPPVVDIPLPVNLPQEFFNSEVDEIPVEEPLSTTSEPEAENISLDINEEVVTLLDDTNEPESLSDEVANVPSSTPVFNNDEEFLSTTDDADISSVQDDSSPESMEEKPKTEPRDDKNISAAPFNDFHGVDTWVDQRDRISPVTLAAGVEELFQISPESPSEETPIVQVHASDDITVISNSALGETPFILASTTDDLFATIDEIALIGEPLPLPPSAETPKPAKNAATKSESTVDILLNTLESINAIEKTEKTNGALEVDYPSSLLKSDPASEIDGWLAEEFSREQIAEPGIIQDFNARAADRLDDIASENDPIAKSRLDSLSLALPDFPDLTQVETTIEQVSPEPAAAVDFISETTPPLENISLPTETSPSDEITPETTPAASEEAMSLQVETSQPVEIVSAAASSISEDVTSWQVDEVSPSAEIIPEATPAFSEEATSWQVEVSPPAEIMSETMPASSEEATMLQPQALSSPVDFIPETGASPSQNATPLQTESPKQVESVAALETFERALAMSEDVESPARQKNTTMNNSAERFPTAALPEEFDVDQAAAPMRTINFAEFTNEKGYEKPDSRWITFREKTVDWIKRALNKLMSLVGARS